VEARLKLADAEYRASRVDPRSGELAEAERNFGEVLRANPQNAEALNGLGLICAQRNRARDAVQYFNAALRSQTNYAPALFNLAVLSQTDFNNKPAALDAYRRYVAIAPDTADAIAARAQIQFLQQELGYNAPRPAPTNTLVRPGVSVEQPRQETNLVTPTRSTAPITAAPKPTEPGNVTTSSETTRNRGESEVRRTQEPPPQQGSPQSATQSPPTSPPATEPVTHSQPQGEPARATNSGSQAPQAREGFFARVNPLNLFHHSPKTAQEPTPLPSKGTEHSESTASMVELADNQTPSQQPGTSGGSKPQRGVIQRYDYHAIAMPAAGNRVAAETAFTQAAQAAKSRRLAQAISAYRQAIEQDPTYFDAYYNLALALSSSGQTSQALLAYETALTLRPNSWEARYNFALLLRQSGYLLDAAAELEKNVAAYPNDASSHLALGNLYANDLGQPARAREHYRRVLEIDPHNPQANAIRYWLAGWQ
jgi:tetratricopeptide (TPR) repeat protein